jgi:3-hydroxyacyl-CoA dehydrogenase / enoyl-CoA hydratase / 3-hydroxybutyryl-CoA epimerase
LETLICTEREADGVLVATIDMPGRTMNVFSTELMDALEALMDQVDADANVKSVVLTSGKSSFLAGADLVMVRGYCDAALTSSHQEMFELCGRLGRQFVRLEASIKPWVAAVNGIVLGGGLELALACRVRVVADDPKIQLGVPEVKLGLLPGAGGTQRLPRLIGFSAAMDLLLSGRSVAPAEAVALGIFKAAVPADQLLDQAKQIARSLNGNAYDATLKFAHLAQTDVPVYSEAVAKGQTLRHNISEGDFGFYPAYSAITDSVLKGARLPMDEANAMEMTQFLRLMFNPVAGNMVRTLFLDRLRAERELAPPAATRIDLVRHGAISPPRNAWTVALGKLKLPKAVDISLPADTLVLTDQIGAMHTFGMRVLEDDPADVEGIAALAVLAPASPHGRVLEFMTGGEVGADAGANTDPAAAAMAFVAERMWCLPWRTPGPHSVLQRLRGQPLAEQMCWALQLASECDPASSVVSFLDVAACLAGVAPAWTGGPLNWARTAPKLPSSGSTAA